MATPARDSGYESQDGDDDWGGSKEAAGKDKCDVEIPAEYNDFAEVFSSAKAAQLPDVRPDNTHAIILEEGKMPPVGKTYLIADDEAIILRE